MSDTKNLKRVKLNGETFVNNEPQVFKVYEATKEDANKIGVVDHKYILARVVGPFFVVDGDSRNGRHYTRALWELAIKRNKDRMLSGRMLGAVGHETDLSDEGLAKGNASHKTTRLWIEGKTGMGEILVLGSASGIELNALLRGDVKLAVSSRAEGEFKGRTNSGNDIIDPETYDLVGFDFVQDPGVSSAYPKLVESVSTPTEPDHKEKGSNMALPENQETSQSEMTVILESNIKQKIQLESQVVELTTQVSESNAETANLRARLKVLEEENKTLKNVKESNSNKSSTILKKFGESRKLLAQYEGLGTPKELSEALERSHNLIKQYSRLGTPEKVFEALTRTSDVLKKYRGLGTVAEVLECTKLLQAYTKLGSLKSLKEKLTQSFALNKATGGKVKESIDQLKVYHTLGTPAEIKTLASVTETYIKLGAVKQLRKAIAESQEYGKLGTVAEVKKLIESTQKVVKIKESHEKLNLVTRLHEKFDTVDRKTINKLVESLGEAEAEDTLTKIAEVSDVRSRYTKNENTTVETVNKDGKQSLMEANLNAGSAEGRTSRLMKQMY